ncbi:5-hydroxytryptamine receptor 1A-alpha-like isoform X1 [Lethenteron reissneri]|uniref:5-hydroxytryptamine receptor 1A-alpha-like isoform X1 n=1 Tax=Lethenteron reissneri TaxID=7753 RepID=UPI002AB6F7A2|nr:5-hydroxytryptamine receptor 1A-alpha-like isoform X1 [Lethenteron reissneri]
MKISYPLNHSSSSSSSSSSLGFTLGYIDTAAAATQSTDISHHHHHQPGPSLLYQTATSSALGALIACSIAGNAFVLAAIYLERSLQTVANYLIGSLAVTDLLVSVLVLPVAALYQVLGRWTLGQAVCDAFIALDVLCCTSSILHLCAIALDRYWAITDPVDYVNKRTPRRAALMIAVTWAVGFSISIPPVLGWRQAEDRADQDACNISQHLGYTIYSTFGAFYIPLVLMLVLYGKIFGAARFRIRSTIKRSQKRPAEPTDVVVVVVSTTPVESPQQLDGVNGGGRPEELPGKAKSRSNSDQTVQQQQQQHLKKQRSLKDSIKKSVMGKARHQSIASDGGSEKRGKQSRRETIRSEDLGDEAVRRAVVAKERKAVKTLGIIMGSFVLCWLPFFVVALVVPFCGPPCKLPQIITALITWLGYSNSLLNPVIYAYFNRDFQNAFKKIARCRCCRGRGRC